MLLFFHKNAFILSPQHHLLNWSAASRANCFWRLWTGIHPPSCDRGRLVFPHAGIYEEASYYYFWRHQSSYGLPDLFQIPVQSRFGVIHILYWLFLAESNSLGCTCSLLTHKQSWGGSRQCVCVTHHIFDRRGRSSQILSLAGWLVLAVVWDCDCQEAYLSAR